VGAKLSPNRLIRSTIVGAANELRGNIISSILTGISLTIGSLSIIGAISASAFVDDALIAPAEIVSGRAITVSAPFAPSTVSLERIKDLGDAQADLRAANVSSYVEWPVDTRATIVTQSARWGLEKPRSIQIVFFSGQRDDVFREPALMHGGSAESRVPSVKINERASVLLGGPGVCPSVKISDITQPMTVCPSAYIVDRKEVAVMYIPLEQWSTMSPTVLPAMDGSVFAHGGLSVSQLTAAVELLGSKLGQVNPRSIIRSDTVAQLNELRATISRIFIIVGLIASGLAMLGILNISLSRAREQVRDIAVRRAVGASRLQVFSEIVGATVAIGMLAAIVAGFIGQLIFTLVIPNYVPIMSGIDPPVFPLASLLAAVLLNSLIAVGGSSIPAFIASRRGFSHYLR
jgi:hypothetical protein